jgi:hypothetical protein
MALLLLHKIMIGVALIFCALFAVRGFALDDPLVGGVFLALTAGLGTYFRWFLAKHRRNAG